ncbi:signal peptidase I [Robinsoniella peoriensis]|uniref:signal peptidase I n=1 Tax=Robinsoniella peoriensis TaxID=180332 RepID=UPI00085BEBB3|nr:signal peptidase I [Robinsoniella peoriensis]
MLKKVCGILSSLLLIILALVAAALIVPHFFGYQTMAVLSGSMEPNIGVGSIAYVKEAPFDELKVGDVISFHMGSDTVVTHRIKDFDLEKQLITTKGDANEVEDAEPVAASSVIGKVGFHIPLMGYISIYAKTPLGIAGICAVFIVLILLVFLPEIFSKDEKKENNKDSKKE